MSNLVDPERIESIVGTKRHQRAHFAKAVSSEQRVYILHSQNCVEDNSDLRDCEFSLALDAGIDIEKWNENTTTLVQVVDGELVPARIGLEGTIERYKQ